ncbi:MAG: hypothetical protein Q8M03_15145 [Legionella sp.]|nr:hypothetical protein [Legionella sp.]
MPYTKSFLNCKKKKRSLFSPLNEKNYHWEELSSKDADNAREIATLFIEVVENASITASYVSLAAKILHCPLSAPPFSLKLSLEHFENIEIKNADKFIKDGLKVLDAILDNNHSVAINYSEIFYVPEGTSPPPHYREGVDQCVDNLDAYRAGKQSHSYQFAKAVITKFFPKFDQKKKPEKIDGLIAHHYSTIKAGLTEKAFINLDMPLTVLPCFDSPLEAFVTLSDKLFGYNRVVLNFSSLVTCGDLSSIISYFNWLSSSALEQIIILRGNYEDAAERQLIYEEIKKIIQEQVNINIIQVQNNIQFLHIILLPEAPVSQTLSQLMDPVQVAADEPFSPLANGAGFYLSAPDIFEAITRNIYKVEQSFFSNTLLNSVMQELPSRQEEKSKAPACKGYIYEPAGENFRQSKLFNKHQLRSQISLTYSHKQELQQMQALDQNQDLARQQTINQQRQQIYKQSHKHDSLLPSVPVSWLLLEFKKTARKLLIQWTSEKRILDNMYYTSHGQGYSELSWLEKLANSKKFGIELIGKIFGLAHSKYSYTKEEDVDSFKQVINACSKDVRHMFNSSQNLLTTPYELTHLPNYSCGSVEQYLEKPIISHMIDFIDGIDPNVRHIGQSYLWGTRTLQGWDAISANNAKIRYKNFIGSRLSLLNKGYQGHLNVSLLLPDDRLKNRDEQKELVACAQSLLTLFTVNPKVDIAEKEAHFLTFIDLYVEKNPRYSAILNKFFTVFTVHNADNLRIFLQLVTLGRKNVESFLEFLIYLDARALLRNFYKIYFQYAPTIFSLVNFFKINQEIFYNGSQSYGDRIESQETKSLEQPESFFITLVKRTPRSDSPDDWPLFEQFCYSCLIFAAKNNISINQTNLEEIEQFWLRISAKFFVYCDSNREEADLLLKQFVSGLVTEDGLALARLGKLETLLTCLENLLDHCMVRHTLREQLSELSGISLVWIDTPYATAYNNFHIVSSDMQIKSGLIGYRRNSYSVSLSELKTIIQEHTYDRDKKDTHLQLKPALFRYLAKESFREDLSFYRALLQCPASNQEEVFLHELIVSFYIVAYTGMNYTPRIAPVSFALQCREFLSAHPEAKTFAHLFETSLNSFFDALEPLKTEQQEGSVNLWMLWREKGISQVMRAKTELPAIFGQKFSRKKLSHFLLQFQQEIEATFPLLSDEPMLAYTLIYNFFDKNEQEKYFQALNLLDLCYPLFSISDLFNQLLEILVFVESLRLMPDPEDAIFLGLNTLLSQQPDINLVTALIKLCTGKLQENADLYPRTVTFIESLGESPALLPHLIHLKPALELLLDYYLSSTIKNLSLPFLLGLCETLKGAKAELSEEDIKTLDVLLNVMQSEDGYGFFLAKPDFTSAQFKNSAKLIKQINEPGLALSFIELALEEDRDTEFDALIACLEKSAAEHLSSYIFLCNWLYSAQGASLLQQLEMVASIPVKFLPDLMRLCTRHSITVDDLSRILASSSMQTAIDEFECSRYEANIERYQYEQDDIAKKIAAIHQKSWNDDPHQSLSLEAQEKLLKEYEQMMACMHEKPVLIENSEGKSQSFTIYQLSSRQFPLLFNELQKKIMRGENKKQNQLLLLALCSEALYRNCGKFPRSTQLLSLMHSLDEEGHLIQEIKTGEGKSIIAAFHAVLLAAEGKTVNVVTENEQLARDGIRVFKPFYQYLGLQCGSNIIEAHSQAANYVPNGVNYSTPYGLALFSMSMDLQKIKLPKNRVLVWDEVDASLTATVQFRLATTLDPLLLETKQWTIVYNYLLSFVQEKAIFLDNKCDKSGDIYNFRHYCLLRNPAKDFTAFINKLDGDLLSTLIDSARVAEHLEADVDYVVITREWAKKSLYAAPILPHTNRPEDRASFADGVQQLLHSKHNAESDASCSFEIEPGSETLVTLSAKNFFDFFRLQGGRCIGITGTAGSSLLLKEFYQEHGFTAVNYPSFHVDRCEDLGIFAAEGWEDQKDLVLSLIQRQKESDLEQPVLIISESPQAAADLKTHLTGEDFPWTTQSYYGYDKPGFSEETFIQDAGSENRISIATKADSRGADFDTAHKSGFLVINLCTKLTKEELLQIKGRAGRNGKPGQICSVIDVLKLGLTKNDAPEVIRRAFEDYQQLLCLNAQKERFKTRLLEDARHHVINNYCIKLRAKADKILMAQEGQACSLVNPLDFMKTLRDFNQNAEAYYADLLENEPELTEKSANQFLDYLIGEYNRILTSWLPAEKFLDYKPLEPEIPLAKLFAIEGINEVKLENLMFFSELLTKAWQEIGHQKITHLFSAAEPFVSALDLYTKGQSGIKTIIAEFLLATDEIKLPEVVQYFGEMEKKFNEFMDEFPIIPGIDSFIPKEKIRKYVNEYLASTKTQIEERNWEQIMLPALDKFPLTSGGMLSKGVVKIIVTTVVMPKLMKVLTTYINERFGNDKPTQLMLLNALKDLKEPVSKFIMAVPFSLKSKEEMWALIFDKFIPLLNHKSIHLAVAAFGEKGEYLLQSVLKFVDILRPYQHYSLPEIINVKTLLPLFHQACQLDLIQQLVKNSAFKEIFNRVSTVAPAFFTMFSNFDFVSLFNLVQVLAHPQFGNFLKNLPLEADFAQLKIWLKTNPENTPAQVRKALSELSEHMFGLEQRAEKNRLKLLNLKGRFTLSIEKLKEGLKALKPLLPREKLPEEEKVIEPEEPREMPPECAPVKKNSRFWLKVISFLAAVIVGILFSWVIIPLVIASATIYLGVVLLSKLKTLFSFSKSEPLPIEEKMIPEEPVNDEVFVDEIGIEPIVVYLSPQEEIANDAPVNNENKEDASSIFAKLRQAGKPFSISGSSHGLFSLPLPNHDNKSGQGSTFLMREGLV